MTYKISDLLNIEELNELFEGFTKLTGAVTALLDMEGNVLIATGWQILCTNYHRVNPETALRCRESDTTLASRLNSGDSYNVYRCRNGLVDVAVPIIIDGMHIGNLFTGQFFFDPPNIQYFNKQAEEFGFDKDEYLEALSKVPIFKEDHVKLLMDFLLSIASLICNMGLSKKQELEQKLLAEKRFSEAVINSLPGVFYLFDDTGKFLLWNKNLETITGYSYEEISVINPPDLVTEEDREAVIRAIGETFKNGRSNIEASFLTKDGRLIPYYFNGFTIEVEGRRCVIGIGIDISERKKIEREIREINLHLQDRIKEEVEKNRVNDRIMFEQSRHIVIGELLVNISHHWRQPLCAIGLLVQDIKDAYLYNEIDIKYIDTNIDAVMSEINMLSETIENFRNFYIHDKDKRYFNVTAEIEKALMLLSGYIKDKGIVIDKILDGDLNVYGFPNEFAQVVLNILTNTKDIFEKRNVINGVIKINSYREEGTGRIIITITDNGGGIEADIITKIFDPYFTTKDKSRGTGNGLYMAKVLIEKNMNGKLSVKNINEGWNLG
ncbi:multi-sensor signal transduction histidine kinase [Candidatus Magnetobacterium bavaricum]|uniref:histidine kinase n=1 Tax=Candidatus Magnetobacterium bavaricum TaxID=29290 RepID=A0A0F3GX26_9BACT|nr:multi-sensor signal transduction histidine kinase [Candidatus Magnetobacterium bavaricum]